MSEKPITQRIKDRLAAYTAMLRDIDNQLERLDRMEMTMASPPGPDLTGMPRGSGTPSDRTGMMNLIATDVAAVVGSFYPAAAVLIGSSGAFVTGTGLGSNIMFADMHIQAAQALGMNPITVFAGQNAGASLGNLICPNNTVAACATVGEEGNEGKVMRKTLVAFGIILVLYMTLTMLYTYVLFPHFGA